jgi:NitT/TauT family transport system substrate-binding protein
MKLSRHAWVVALALSLVATLLPTRDAHAQSPTPIKFTMDWRIEGPSVFFLLPLYKGYFAAEGLDVTVDIGTGSAAAVQRIATGAYDMGAGDMSALIEFMGNNPGAPSMQAVYTIYDAAPGAVFFWKKLGIKTPADLAGKRLATSVFDAIYRAFPLITAANKQLDAGSVKWAVGDPQIKEQMMMRGEADGVTAFFATGYLNLIARGAKAEDIGWFKFEDLGVKNLYGNAVFASSKLINERPQAVAAFVRAFNKGFKEVVADPVGAMQYAKRRDALIDEAREVERLKLALTDIVTPATKAEGFGAMRKDKLVRQVEDVAVAFKTKTKPPVEGIFNDRFLPPVAERR